MGGQETWEHISGPLGRVLEGILRGQATQALGDQGRQGSADGGGPVSLGPHHEAQEQAHAVRVEGKGS
jgi:hypothetical protein